MAGGSSDMSVTAAGQRGLMVFLDGKDCSLKGVKMTLEESVRGYRRVFMDNEETKGPKHAHCLLVNI